MTNIGLVLRNWALVEDYEKKCFFNNYRSQKSDYLTLVLLGNAFCVEKKPNLQSKIFNIIKSSLEDAGEHFYAPLLSYFEYSNHQDLNNCKSAQKLLENLFRAFPEKYLIYPDVTVKDSLQNPPDKAHKHFQELCDMKKQQQLCVGTETAPYQLNDGDLLLYWKTAKENGREFDFIRLYSDALTNPSKTQKHLIHEIVINKIINKFRKISDNTSDDQGNLFDGLLTDLFNCGEKKVTDLIIHKLQEGYELPTRPKIRAVLNPIQVEKTLQRLAR